MDEADLLPRVRALVPPLTGDKHKGQAGKVAVVGGCAEYTGAPYFAAAAALRAGADIAHVFATGGAAPVIKAYSPELIVHPYLPEGGAGADPGGGPEAAAAAAAALAARVAASVEAVDAWLDRFDAVVVGPGLGRGPEAQDAAAGVVAAARARGLPLVLDADGLWLAARSPELVRGYPLAVLTPNAVEFGRLATLLGLDAAAPGALAAVAAALGGPLVVRKGAADAVAGPGFEAACAAEGSPRRAGGQGDVLAGCIATFAAWAARGAGGPAGLASPRAGGGPPPLGVAAYAGCLLTRGAARRAYAARRRAMGAPDVIDHLHLALEELLGEVGGGVPPPAGA